MAAGGVSLIFFGDTKTDKSLSNNVSYLKCLNIVKFNKENFNNEIMIYLLKFINEYLYDTNDEDDNY